MHGMDVITNGLVVYDGYGSYFETFSFHVSFIELPFLVNSLHLALDHSKTLLLLTNAIASVRCQC